MSDFKEIFSESCRWWSIFLLILVLIMMIGIAVWSLIKFPVLLILVGIVTVPPFIISLVCCLIDRRKKKKEEEK